MTAEKQDKKLAHHILRATPNEEFYIELDTGERGRQLMPNMNREQVRDFIQNKWPGKYSDAEIDERLRAAQERLKKAS